MSIAQVLSGSVTLLYSVGVLALALGEWAGHRLAMRYKAQVVLACDGPLDYWRHACCEQFSEPPPDLPEVAVWWPPSLYRWNRDVTAWIEVREWAIRRTDHERARIIKEGRA